MNIVVHRGMEEGGGTITPVMTLHKMINLKLCRAKRFLLTTWNVLVETENLYSIIETEN